MLSIPPYVSVAWKNIASLHAEYRLAQTVLVISLLNGSILEIPNLDGETLEIIFFAHARYMESELPIKKFSLPITPDFPMPTDGGGIENVAGALQHNPDLANTPDLPEDFLKKIADVTKVISIDENLLSKPEPHCNCVHCQIARAIHKTIDGSPEQQEEVTEEDLKFRTWDIDQSGDKLYIVKNPLDEKEQYSVFLGEPIGCTCGEKNCEHIQAVLKS